MITRPATIPFILVALWASPASAQDHTVYSERDILAAGGVLPAQESCPELEYPEDLARRRVSGRVILRFVVAADGFVDPASFETVESTHPEFERSLKIMVINCRYRPGRLGENESPVAVLMQSGMRFGVSGGRPEPISPDDAVTIDHERIFDDHETLDGRPVLTVRPKLVDCPKYDPQERPGRARAADRYEGPERIERMPTKVEALIEMVIGVDGVPDKKLSRILETSDRQVDARLLQWVQSCRFTPGKIGDRPVRVRIEFPVTYTFVRS